MFLALNRSWTWQARECNHLAIHRDGSSSSSSCQTAGRYEKHSALRGHRRGVNVNVDVESSGLRPELKIKKFKNGGSDPVQRLTSTD